MSAQRVVKPGQVARVEQDEAESGQRSTDRYAKRVIVQQGDDEVTTQAARNLAAKHGENTAVVKAGPGGELEGLDKLAPTGGKVKVQVVGHGDEEGGTLGDANARKLAQQIEQVKSRLGEEAEVSKVTLVGCRTACGTEDQPSLTRQVQAELAKQGTEVGEVKGRDTYVKVDAEGHKIDTDDNNPDSLSKLGKLWDQFKGKFKKATPQTDSIQPMDVELAKYIEKKKNEEGNLDREDIDALVRATETVRSVRGMLRRGNVSADIDETNARSYLKVAIGREIMSGNNMLPNNIQNELNSIDPIVKRSAVAKYMGAGNCGENADCAFMEHATRIRKGERLFRISDRNIDHGYVVLVNKNKSKILIDPWHDGPAIFLKDSVLAENKRVPVLDPLTYENRLKYINQDVKLKNMVMGGEVYFKRAVEAATERVGNDKKIGEIVSAYKNSRVYPPDTYSSSSAINFRRFGRVNRVTPQ
ncbi:hypothetical protein CFB82_41185 [Burkholderia sp. HI2714]|nr:hypothetical protein CFB82_41185 [Burkholderia sp. HI2714]